MKCIYSLFISLSLVCSACSQSIRTICNLPTSLSENSGMVLSEANRIWLHNDGGDSSKLYLVDTLGTVLRTIWIQNASNLDWEDITHDAQGTVYVGDFGNNLNTRQNLRIYKIPHPDSIVGTSVMAEVINFHYPEQSAYPPSNSSMKYDAEAMVFFQDSIYIFTKDRTSSPHQGYTWLYQVPVDTGNHAAILMDSFPTQQTSYIFEVTGAALSPNQEALTLLGANKIWLFRNFSGSRFFDGIQQTISFSGVSQKEAIDFLTSTKLYFSSEQSFLGPAQLGEVDLSALFLGNLELSELEALKGVEVYPNPSSNSLNIKFKLKKSGNVVVSLIDNSGKRIRTLTKETLQIGEHHFRYNLDDLPNGYYFVEVKGKRQRFSKRIIMSH